MSTTDVDLAIEKCVATITFRSDNGINILSAATRLQLKQCLTRLEKVKDCRVVVFRGEGKTFLAGADIREMQKLDYASAFEFSREGQLLLQRISDLRAVSICAIHAPCLGGGFELGLACDFRIASDEARIGLPEVTLGLVPGWGGSVRATLLFGGTIAKRLILTGAQFGGIEAHWLGLVDEVVRSENFEKAVHIRIQHVLKAGPLATAACQNLVETVLAHDLDSLLKLEASHFASCFNSDEPHEGISAFLEKRPAAWIPRPEC